MGTSGNSEYLAFPDVTSIFTLPAFSQYPATVGGLPSPAGRTYLRRNGEDIRVKPHRMVEVHEGDILVKHSSGGGGVGNPAECDPEMGRENLE